MFSEGAAAQTEAEATDSLSAGTRRHFADRLLPDRSPLSVPLPLWTQTVGEPPLAERPARRGEAMSYLHRPLVASQPSGPANPAGTGRLSDLLEFVKQEFDGISGQAESLRRENVEFSGHGGCESCVRREMAPIGNV